MKLVCFSNNTAGGLVCDLLNQKISQFDGYKTNNHEHHLFDVGDAAGVYRDYDQKLWHKKLIENKNKDIWMGTHLHPSAIKDLSDFQEVIAITTTSLKSQYYRWLRYYNGWFLSNEKEFLESKEIDRVDKIRELVKNVFDVFGPDSRCKNVEFESIVDGSFVIDNNLDFNYYLNWKSKNTWLYDNSSLWATKRFYEALYESGTGLEFQYSCAACGSGFNDLKKLSDD